MAVVRIPAENRSLQSDVDVAAYLAGRGIDFERWAPGDRGLSAGASSEAILSAYSDKIDALKAQGGYVTADVIDVKPDTPGLETMLAKFNSEHWHDEDEVRLIVAGKGIFHIHPKDGPIVAIEVEAGDLIRVPAGTRHWFDLCDTRTIRAIRLFRDPAGWTPRYTESGAESGYQPICLGPPRPDTAG